MTLTITQNITTHTLTVTSNGDIITLNPVVNTVSSAPEVVSINGFNVVASGKTDLTAFQVGDKFSGWDNDWFVVGKILSTPVILPADLNDKTKVGLVINTTY